MFTRIEPDPGFVNVRTAMLEDSGRAPPFIETYLSKALPWARIGARYGYEKFPEMSDFPALLAEYAGPR